ncbi:hypothetical protein [Rubinisphaera sp. JC750]|uniref:hypothetical protein n=1 Tax=Rubinisphaera sp. JC750 TaxID=2898658 RepID=UPI001F296705|nr:hypothetical protein [Rubinisphaera sp. JC750]
MPRGRRKNSLGISLFAFQDIIMSVTGVLILIVLLLVLELVTQTVPDDAQDRLREIAQALQAEIASLSAEAAAMERHVESDEETVQRAIENPQSVIGDRMQQEQARLDQLEDRLKSLEAVGQELSEEAEEQAGQMDVLTDRERQIADLQRKKREILHQLDQLTKHEATRYMTPHGINPAQAWLCDVNQRGLTLRLLDGGPEKRVTVPRWDDDGEAAFAQLKSTLRTITPRVRYILFVIRPSGREFNDPLVIQGEQLNLEFGVEYVAEDHVILQ